MRIHPRQRPATDCSTDPNGTDSPLASAVANATTAAASVATAAVSAAAAAVAS